MLASLVLLRRVARAFPLLRGGRATVVERDLVVEYLRGQGTMAELFTALSSVDVAVQSIAIEDDGERGRPGVRRTVLHVSTDDVAALASVAEGLSELAEVQAVGIEPHGERPPERRPRRRPTDTRRGADARRARGRPE